LDDLRAELEDLAEREVCESPVLADSEQERDIVRQMDHLWVQLSKLRATRREPQKKFDIPGAEQESRASILGAKLFEQTLGCAAAFSCGEDENFQPPCHETKQMREASTIPH